MSMPADQLVNDYVAAWNEGDPVRRRERIASVWAADGRTCHRLADSHGYEEIEQRVVGSWRRWISEGKYLFRPAWWRSHHDVVQLRFELIRREDGAVEARGLSFLLLDAEGRVRCDYQFNPTVNEAEDLVERYLAPANEPTEDRRAVTLIETWSADATLMTEGAAARGRRAVARAFEDLRAAGVRQGLVHAAGGGSQRHHDVAWIRWMAAPPETDRPVLTRSDMLVFDDAGRIQSAYGFAEPAEASVSRAAEVLEHSA
jgi:hypothetical protein